MCGLAMTPRVILMTDGEPTDREGPEKVRDSLLPCKYLSTGEEGKASSPKN